MSLRSLATMEATAVIDFNAWMALVDTESVFVDPVCLAFDVTPDRGRGTISAAGVREDGLLHLETIEARPGTGWMPTRIAELVATHEVVNGTCAPASPAAAIIRPLENLNIELEPVSARDYASACGMVYDLIEQEGFRHLGTDELSAAVKNAATRPLGEAWAWSRRHFAARS